MLPFVELGDPGAQVFLLDATVHVVHRFHAHRIGDQFPEGAAVFFAAGVGIQGGAGGALAQQFFQFLGFHAQGMGQF